MCLEWPHTAIPRLASLPKCQSSAREYPKAYPRDLSPLPLKPPVAMAVFPKNGHLYILVFSTGVFHLFRHCNSCVLSITLPSLSVSTNLSARWRTIISGLFVCYDFSHVCFRSATAFSVSPACDQAAMANKTTPSEHHIKASLHSGLPFVVWDSEETTRMRCH